MKWLLIILLTFLVVYMAFAFVNWDIAWVAHVDMITRLLFILILVSFYPNVGKLLFKGELDNERNNRKFTEENRFWKIKK